MVPPRLERCERHEYGPLVVRYPSIKMMYACYQCVGAHLRTACQLRSAGRWIQENTRSKACRPHAGNDSNIIREGKVSKMVQQVENELRQEDQEDGGAVKMCHVETISA